MDDSRIIQFSTGRSGSTMVWQVLKELFPNRVIKCHEKELSDIYEECRGNLKCPVVATQRDPRDVLISIIKIRHFINDVERIKTDLDRSVLLQYIGELKYKEALLRHYTSPHVPNPLLLLRYEDFYNDYDHLFDTLETFFAIKIDLPTRRRLEESTSIRANMDRQKKFNTFAEVDPESNIHGDHITFPDPGSHRLVLSENDCLWLEQQLVNEISYWDEYWKHYQL
jgi:hypothetical protein